MVPNPVDFSIQPDYSKIHARFIEFSFSTDQTLSVFTD
jgi:hypothetical protein